MIKKNIIFIHFFISASFLHANMIRDMGLMMGAQMGGSIANQALTEQFDQLFTNLTNNQKNISSAINVFQIDMKNAQTVSLTHALEMLQKAQAHVTTSLSDQQKGLAEMDRYIQAAVRQQVPAVQYLQDPVKYDQIFTAGTMYTPQGLAWKNLFPIGNWEYDENSDSFWQMSHMPLMAVDAQGTLSPEQAINNMIFAEWISRSSSYELECEITLYNISYPFFVGLIFNKARWVSGDMQRFQKYRVVGLYGSSQNKLQSCFAEFFSSKQSTKNSAPILNFPLSQILQNKGVLSDFNVEIIQEMPVVFGLKVKTSANQIQIKFWPKILKEPTQFIKINSINPDLFLYHGIGFIAPGCMAQFKLIKPQEVLFSQVAQEQFKNETQSFISNAITKQYAGIVDTLAVDKSGVA